VRLVITVLKVYREKLVFKVLLAQKAPLVSRGVVVKLVKKVLKVPPVLKG
jgi:hypothetical protein